LAALDESKPPVFEGEGTCIHLRRPSYVELRNLVLSKATGNGLNIDDGGDANNPAREIVLRQLQVREIGPRGNRDGIKLSGVNQFSIEGCTIERWGDGGSAIDMVGCHEGQISNCEFKYRGDIQANGVQTKGGSSEITIKRCRFENAGGRAVNIGGSTGRDYFRPPSAGYEAKNITVEDCTFIGSLSPIVFVGVDGATVRYNTIYRPTRWIIRILQESQGAEFVPCRNGSFTNNVIAFRSDEARTVVNIGGGTAPATFTFAGNHWYCLDNPQRSNRLDLPVEETKGTYGEDPQFVNTERHDLQLKRTSRVRDAGVRSQNER
ncbi:MAG TPA: right-handed parallel beta-helix repeat-containing protein, partial [Planctomycetaceae bacterium]|nr:right-handed parallel beta-helix repeat-containing protein [Planctomycetaceae bacterium]